MLEIRFKRNSEPITDAELLSVIGAIRPAMATDGHGQNDFELLLAKMLFRIRELEAQVAALRKTPGPPGMRYLADSFDLQKTE